MAPYSSMSSRAKAAPDASPLVDSRSRHRLWAEVRRRPPRRLRTSSRPASAIDVHSWSSIPDRLSQVGVVLHAPFSPTGPPAPPPAGGGHVLAAPAYGGRAMV